MTGYSEFAAAVFDALRSQLSAEAVASVDFYREHGETGPAVVRALAAAGDEQLSLPPDLLEEVRSRLSDGKSFRPKDADFIRHFLPSIRTASAA